MNEQQLKLIADSITVIARLIGGGDVDRTKAAAARLAETVTAIAPADVSLEQLQAHADAVIAHADAVEGRINPTGE